MSVQVLFCRLSQEQRELYQQYLDSKEVQAILAGNYKVGLVLSSLYMRAKSWYHDQSVRNMRGKPCKWTERVTAKNAIF